MKKAILKYVCTHWVYDVDDVDQIIEWIGFKEHFDHLVDSREKLWRENEELKARIEELTKPITVQDEVVTVKEEVQSAPKKRKHYNKSK